MSCLLVVLELNTKAFTCEQCVIVVLLIILTYFLCKGGIEKSVPVVHHLS